MSGSLDHGAWSPFLVGALIGVLAWGTFYFSRKPIGASSFYATVSGLLGRLVAPRHTASLLYFRENPPAVDWEFVLVISVVFGAFLSAFTAGEFSWTTAPPMWAAKFGNESVARYAFTAFGGGVFMAVGARLANGCTSGHGISGTLQLNVASWISVICFFAGGVFAIRLFY